MSWRLIPGVTLGTVLFGVLSPAWAIPYHVTTIHPYAAIGYSINDRGQISGNWAGPSGTQSNRGFVAQADLSIIDLGTFGGDTTYAVAINDNGQTAGLTTVAPTDGSSVRAFRGAHNRRLNFATDNLGSLGGGMSDGAGINNLGQVVGSAVTSNGDWHAFRTRPNMPIDPATDDLGTFMGSNSRASAINELGQVVGFSEHPDRTIHAFRTGPNAAMNPATDDLGKLPGRSDCRAIDINERGEVVGNCGPQAFRTRPNEPIDPVYSPLRWNFSIYAHAINDLGWIVGSMDSPSGQRAFVFDGTRVIDLNDVLASSGEGWILREAHDINNAGQIVGSATYDGNRAFLLTPVIPEPRTVVIAALGAVVIIVRVWRDGRRVLWTTG